MAAGNLRNANPAVELWNLDTAQGAVEKWDCHNGRFEVETQPGSGTMEP